MVMGKEQTAPQQATDHPLFIPPRKRQASKKCNGSHNYVDHIVSVQSRHNQSPTSPVQEDALLKSSLILKKSTDNLSIASCRELNSSARASLASGISSGAGGIDLMHLHGLHTPTSKDANPLASCMATPSSYSESSLDAKSNRSHDCLTGRSVSKKRVNIITDADCRPTGGGPSRGHYNYDEDLESGETHVLHGTDLDEHSLSRYTTMSSVTTDSYLTMTGTIKRGRKKGQSVDLQINMSREELEKINAAMTLVAVEHATPAANRCFVCSRSIGLHVLLLSLLCLPFVTVITAVYSFYIGTLTWYNVFNYFSEEKSCVHRILMSPLLVLLYPLLIVCCTIGLGVYAGCVQLSVRFTSWLNEIGDIEKGFYGWLCSFLRMSDCSPYEVVVLVDMKLPPTAEEAAAIQAASSTEELSL